MYVCVYVPIRACISMYVSLSLSMYGDVFSKRHIMYKTINKNPTICIIVCHTQQKKDGKIIGGGFVRKVKASDLDLILRCRVPIKMTRMIGGLIACTRS